MDSIFGKGVKKSKEIEIAKLPYEEQVAIVGKGVADQIKKVSESNTLVVTNVCLKTKTITVGHKK